MNIQKLLVASACLMMSSMAHALESISQTLQLGPHATDWTTNALLVPNADMLYAPMEFTKFDSSLGRLTGVRIEIQGSFTATMRIFNTGSHTLQSASVSVDMKVDVFNDGDAESAMTMTDEVGPPALPLALTQPGQFLVDATVSGSVSDQLNINTSQFGAYIDNGSGPLGTFRVGCGSTSMHIANIVPTDGLALFTHQADSSCQVTVVYEYALSGVALPGSLLLLVSGGLGFGFQRCRGRERKEAWGK